MSIACRLDRHGDPAAEPGFERAQRGCRRSLQRRCDRRGDGEPPIRRRPGAGPR